VSKVSGAVAGELVGLSADEIKVVAQAYTAELQRQEAATKSADGCVPLSRKQQAQAFTRQIEVLQKKLELADQALTIKQTTFEETQARVKSLQSELSDSTTYNNRIVQETTKLDEIENSVTNKAALANLKTLVELNENLKNQETQFKFSCKKQRDELVAALRKLESGEDDEETKQLREVEQIYEQDQAKLDKLRRVLAAKNQGIMKMNREIDEIPTRAELIQYERRFVELYEQVAEKLSETRKYYAMYNTLNDSAELIKNEVSLLNAIAEGFERMIKSKNAAAPFLEQFEQILAGVRQTLEAREQDMAAEKTAVEALNMKYNALLEKQRNYFKVVKEFQDECNKNEALEDMLQQASS